MPDPLMTLFVGTVTVVGCIVILRANPFLALIAGALLVSFCCGVEEVGAAAWTEPVHRVLDAFGIMAGKIGLLLVMGSIIGRCMAESGAADRLVRQICRLVGRKRLAGALMGSGFLLSIPVFYDATFYLLLPLAKSIYRITQKNYILYLLAIGFGATLSHTLVPPTPGPLIVAETMKISVGTMILFGVIVGSCMIPFALAIAALMNWFMPHPKLLPGAVENGADDGISFDEFVFGTGNDTVIPSFGVAVLPVAVPALLIACRSIVGAMMENGRLLFAEHATLIHLLSLLGEPTVALSLGAVIAVATLAAVRRLSFRDVETALEPALVSAGMIILITSAGGAFGAMLRESGIGPRLQELTGACGSASGVFLLILAFATSAMIKTAQGSSTTAMITASGIFSAMNLGVNELGFHPGYLAVTIGIGSCVTGWMNDSGFCIFSRMSGVREVDALKTWTVGLALLGASGLLVVLVLSQLFPMTNL
ncbi:MAG: GntP family permease [Planctomycetia bacterium]|nr:GntP family permease [Planctomycetia bacterium]